MQSAYMHVQEFAAILGTCGEAGEAFIVSYGKDENHKKIYLNTSVTIGDFKRKINIEWTDFENGSWSQSVDTSFMNTIPDMSMVTTVGMHQQLPLMFKQFQWASLNVVRCLNNAFNDLGWTVKFPTPDVGDSMSVEFYDSSNVLQLTVTVASHATFNRHPKMFGRFITPHATHVFESLEVLQGHVNDLHPLFPVVTAQQLSHDSAWVSIDRLSNLMEKLYAT